MRIFKTIISILVWLLIVSLLHIGIAKLFPKDGMNLNDRWKDFMRSYFMAVAVFYIGKDFYKQYKK